MLTDLKNTLYPTPKPAERADYTINKPGTAPELIGVQRSGYCEELLFGLAQGARGFVGSKRPFQGYEDSPPKRARRPAKRTTGRTAMFTVLVSSSSPRSAREWFRITFSR